VRRLLLYSRPGCHLCEEMKHVVSRALQHMPAGAAALCEIDISGDPSLEDLYGREIPVLLIDGRKAAKYRMTERELLRKLGA